mmetsp:Transcript_15403/g.38973  ORF Transcript_15403/g.38973 Transcript_15403/m.38973 type:complete len:218 (+) Transcript_15403:2369-3022(+)
MESSRRCHFGVRWCHVLFHLRLKSTNLLIRCGVSDGCRQREAVRFILFIIFNMLGDDRLFCSIMLVHLVFFNPSILFVVGFNHPRFCRDSQCRLQRLMSICVAVKGSIVRMRTSHLIHAKTCSEPRFALLAFQAKAPSQRILEWINFPPHGRVFVFTSAVASNGTQTPPNTAPARLSRRGSLFNPNRFTPPSVCIHCAHPIDSHSACSHKAASPINS